MSFSGFLLQGTQKLPRCDLTIPFVCHQMEKNQKDTITNSQIKCKCQTHDLSSLFAYLSANYSTLCLISCLIFISQTWCTQPVGSRIRRWGGVGGGVMDGCGGKYGYVLLGECPQSTKIHTKIMHFDLLFSPKLYKSTNLRHIIHTETTSRSTLYN